MKKSCLKTLHPRPYTLNPNLGFTLIELLVVVTIIALLTGGGIAAYSNFNENQILSQAAYDLRVNLRDAQNRALSGEKPAGCSVLDGYQVNFSSNSYAIQAVCGGVAFGELKTVTLPSGVTINPLPSPDTIKFKSLTHGTDISGEVTITLNFGSRTPQLVIVNAGGEIR